MLENSMKKLARLISGQYKIQLYFEGKQACTDGNAIYLPALPDKIEVEFRKEIEGFLDHEVAHCLFTDFGVSKFDNDLHRFMTNACEDTRIERLMIDKYPGCRYNLDFINEKWGKINEERWSELPAIFRISDNVRRIMDGRKLRLDADTKALFSKKVVSLAQTLNAATTTAQVHNITKKITQLILNPPADEEKSECENTEGSDANEGSSDEGNEGSNDEGNEGSNEGNEGSDEGNEGSSDEGNEGSNEGNEGSNEGNEGNEDTESRKNSKGSKAGKKTGKKQGKGKRPKIEQTVSADDILQNTDSDVPVDIHSYIESQVQNIRQENQDYIPAKSSADKIVDLSQVTSSSYKSLLSPLRALIDKTTIELDEVLTAESDTGWRTEQDAGAINNKALVKVLTSPGYDRPFKMQKREENRDIGVTLVIDQSGSMHDDDKIKTAQKTAIILAEALQSLDIKVEIGGFTTTGKYNVIGASRQQGIELTIFKSFNSENLQSLSLIKSSNTNIDGESIRYFAERLHEQPNKRKIMFVLSDGQPFCHTCKTSLLEKDLKNAVSDIENVGIEIVGIGIQTGAVQDFYPKNIVVEKVDDLPKILMNKLKNMLAA